MSRIVTVTMNPTVDVSTRIDRAIPERKLRCSTLRYEPGGGGVNVARAIRILGADALALYPSGGALGAKLTQMLTEESVRHSVIKIGGETRQSIALFETSSGQQFRIALPGPALHDSEWREMLHMIEEVLHEDDLCVCSGSLPDGVPEDFYAHIAETVRKKRARMLLDSSGPALTRGIDNGVFMVKPNMRELRTLAGEDIKDEQAQESICRDMVERGAADVVLLSLGAGGALLVDARQTSRLRAPSVPAKSKVGAGDSMMAGFVLSLCKGRPVEQAACYGIAAGASAVMTPGSQLCRRADTEKLFDRICPIQPL